jgi:hypothetical protein
MVEYKNNVGGRNDFDAEIEVKVQGVEWETDTELI